jgi:hypothetical protein
MVEHPKGRQQLIEAVVTVTTIPQWRGKKKDGLPQLQDRATASSGADHLPAETNRTACFHDFRA